MAVPLLKKIFQWQKAINEFIIRKEGRTREGAFGREKAGGGSMGRPDILTPEKDQ